MTIQSTSLAQLALDKSLDVREDGGFDFMSPLCIYDLCDTLGVKVQFVDDISMEGIFVPFKRPTILLSSLRPLPRRVFNCAHELGHQVFEHGWTVDELKNEMNRADSSPEEFLVNAFAGFLLMPALGVTRAFTIRGWSPWSASPEQIFVVACSFGVGYTTMVSHLSYGLNMIGHEKAVSLKKTTPSAIRAMIIGKKTSQSLTVADQYYARPTLDVEVGMSILLPSGAEVESGFLEHVSDVANGRVFTAKEPGLVRVDAQQGNWAVVVRISKFQYAGLSQYRHLEEADCD